MTIEVRPPEPRDEAAWRRLFHDYIEFYEARVPEPVIDLTWQRVLGREDGMLGLVAATAGGEAVGLAHAVLHRSTWSATWYCYLEDLYVDPAARGGGVGRALIERVFGEADALGCTRTYWVTRDDNATARRLYDRLATTAPFVQYRRT